MDVVGSEPRTPGKQKTEKKLYRHSPYKRPSNSHQCSESYVERVLNLYHQISRPLLNRSLTGPRESAFAVPWRTEDRETTQLREELEAAQKRAAEADAQRIAQLQIEEESRKLERAAQEEEQLPASVEEQPEIPAAPDSNTEPESQAADKAEGVGDEVAEPLPAAIAEPISEQTNAEEAADTPAATHSAPSKPEPQYESVFETARRLAEERATGIAQPPKLKPNPYITPATVSQPKSTYKGKGVEVSRIPSETVARFEPEESQLAAAKKIASVDDDEDDDDEEDQDFEPNISEDDDEEEALQEEMDPINEDEEVTSTVADDISLGDTVENTEQLLVEQADVAEVQQPESEDVSLDVSVVEDSASELEHDSQQEELAESEPVSDAVLEEIPEETASIADAESDVAPVEDISEPAHEADDAIAIAASDSDNESADGAESDQATEELASMASEDEGPYGDVTAQIQSTPASPTSRGWWPFSGHSLFGSQTNTDQPPALKHAAEDTESDAENQPSSTRRRFSESPRSPKNQQPIRHVVPSMAKPMLQPRPYVPLSFLDISATGKRMRRLGSSALEHTSSDTLVDALPQQEHSPQAVAMQEKPAKPLISAASLGIGKGPHDVDSTRRKPLLQKRVPLYYGAGYGSRSIPYAQNVSYSTQSAPAFKKPSSVAKPELTGSKSSITAQKILDIIGEVPPPARSQAIVGGNADGFLPCELEAPPAHGIRPRAVQQRRVLQPLSARLAKASDQPAASKGQSAKQRAAENTKSLMASIQSAAPPAVQVKLAQASESQARLEKDAKKVLAKESAPAPAPKTPSLFAKAPEPLPDGKDGKASSGSPAVTVPKSDAPKPAFVFNVPKISQPSPQKQQQQPVATSDTLASSKAKSCVSAKDLALAIGEQQLPKFSFEIPLPTTAFVSAGVVAQQKAAAGIDVDQLPVFAFTVDVGEVPRLSKMAKEAAAIDPAPVANLWGQSGFKLPALKDGEWKCPTCMITNTSTASKCASCEESKPVPKTAAKADAATASAVPNLWAQSGFKVPAAKEGEWKCPTCMITNSSTASKCASCEEAKPNGKTDAPAAASSVSLWAQSGFKTPALKDGEWKCAVCDLRNPQEAHQCTVCDSPKPVAGTTGAQSTPVVANLWAQSGFKMPTIKSDEWKCPTCMITNANAATKCAACNADKPLNTAAATASASVTGLSTKPLGQKTEEKELPEFSFELDYTRTPAAPTAPAVPNLWAQSGLKMPTLKDGEWKCSLCMITNPAKASACSVCETPK
ncbi:E3 SUMO-protein ligase RanBP2 [Coemansia sp. Benny D115]|nr:E3 SUMO-protein ligase RanBP2 [Coemansia sp. Benny D115]